MKPYRYLLIISLVLWQGILNGQNYTSKDYKNFTRNRRSYPASQYMTILHLNSDSTYKKETFTDRTFKDDKANYLNWSLDESHGKWNKVNNRTIYLIYGSFKTKYHYRKNSIKMARLQTDINGHKVIKYQRWVLERKPKYKLIK